MGESLVVISINFVSGDIFLLTCMAACFFSSCLRLVKGRLDHSVMFVKIKVIIYLMGIVPILYH